MTYYDDPANQPKLMDFAQKVVIKDKETTELATDYSPEEMFAYLSTLSSDDDRKNNLYQDCLYGYVVDLQGKKHDFKAVIGCVHIEAKGCTSFDKNSDIVVYPQDDPNISNDFEVKFDQKFALPDGLDANDLLNEFLNRPSFDEKLIVESTGKAVNPRDFAYLWYDELETWITNSKNDYLLINVVDDILIDTQHPVVLPIGSSEGNRLYACNFNGNVRISTGDNADMQITLYTMISKTDEIYVVENVTNHQKVTVSLCEGIENPEFMKEVNGYELLNHYFKNVDNLPSKLKDEHGLALSVEELCARSEIACKESAVVQKKSERDSELDEIEGLLTARCGKSMAKEIMAGANRDVDEQSSTQIRHSQRAVRHH